MLLGRGPDGPIVGRTVAITGAVLPVDGGMGMGM